MEARAQATDRDDDQGMKIPGVESGQEVAAMKTAPKHGGGDVGGLMARMPAQ